ncbi:MAG: hypothetical protein JOY80_10700 [Candidatus Dormibacteraeota bacterium]|nr:hypothetical protein [Candidatus Dormibacteraeota bacterium]
MPEPLEMYDLSVPVEDGLATVERCAQALADAGVNIDAVNYSAAQDVKSIHLLVHDGVDAAGVLERALSAGVTCRPVHVYTLPNRPGILARYAGALVDAGLAIEFMYQATAKGVVVAAPDLDAVRAVFADAARNDSDQPAASPSN